jgi:hypothetical protein
MRLKKNVASSDSGFIFNPSTGDSYTANQTATEILQMMKSGKTKSEILNDLHSVYDVEVTQLEKDWDDLMSQLRDANLLEI